MSSDASTQARPEEVDGVEEVAVNDTHGHDDHGHDDHGHDDHGHDESARWVLVPVAVGLVIGMILVLLLGLQFDADAFNRL